MKNKLISLLEDKFLSNSLKEELNTFAFLKNKNNSTILKELEETPKAHPLSKVAFDIIEEVIAETEAKNKESKIFEEPELHIVQNITNETCSSFEKMINQKYGSIAIDEKNIFLNLQEKIKNSEKLAHKKQWLEMEYLKPLANLLCVHQALFHLEKGNHVSLLSTDNETNQFIQKATKSISQSRIHIHGVVSTSNYFLEYKLQKHFNTIENKDTFISHELIYKDYINNLCELEKTLEYLKNEKTFSLYEQTHSGFSKISEHVTHEGYNSSFWNKFGLTFSYKGLWFKNENHTADLLLFAHHEGELKIALIQRATEPFKGLWATPGGFVDTTAKAGSEFILGLETPEQAALREFEEETLGKTDATLISIGTFDNLGRDPRNGSDSWVVSHGFTAYLGENIIPLKSTEETMKASWVLVSDILDDKICMAFDHKIMVKTAFQNLKLTLELSPKPKNKLKSW